MDEMKIKGIIIFVILVAWVIYSTFCFLFVHGKCEELMRSVINKDANKSAKVLYELITDICIFIVLTIIVIGIVFCLFNGG